MDIFKELPQDLINIVKDLSYPTFWMINYNKVIKDIRNFNGYQNTIFKADYQKTKSNIIKRCPKKCSIRQGYTSCECSGSGYINFE